MRKGIVFALCACSFLGALFLLQPVAAQTLSQAVAPSTLQQAVKPVLPAGVDPLAGKQIPLPDLVPVSCAFGTPQVAFGTQDIIFRVVYRNQGTANAVIGQGTWEWIASRDQTSTNNLSCFNSSGPVTLTPGSDRNLGFHFTLPVNLAPGTYTYTVKVDPNNTVAESNEANNEMTCTLTILPPGGDLSITGLTVNPAAPVSTNPFVVYVTVKNTGKDALTIPSNTVMVRAAPYADDAKVSETSTHVLQPGVQWTYPLKPTAAGKQKGTQTWTFTVDPDNRVNERMETNNQATLSITVN
jgi:hypothetical protein